jgi:hypothetical protein
VDDDDWLTPTVDESGGLDPRMLYVSYLDGVSFALLDRPLADDVDALTATPLPMVPAPCSTGPATVWADGFEPYPGGSVIGLGGWESYPGTPAFDALITSQRARTGQKSLMPIGVAHAVQPLAGVSGGTWALLTYVHGDPTASGTVSLHLFSEYDASNMFFEIAASLEFDPAGGEVRDSVTGDVMSLSFAGWPEVRAEMDLGANLVEIYIDGVPFTTHPWTGAPGVGELAAVSVESDAAYLLFVDDFSLYGEPDCNNNGVSDLCDIVLGTSYDTNANGIPDECEMPPVCPGDGNCDGRIDWRDIDYFVAAQNDNVAAWTAMFAPAPPPCPFANNDANMDGTVNWRDIDPFVALMNTLCP